MHLFLGKTQLQHLGYFTAQYQLIICFAGQNHFTYYISFLKKRLNAWRDNTNMTISYTHAVYLIKFFEQFCATKLSPKKEVYYLFPIVAPLWNIKFELLAILFIYFIIWVMQLAYIHPKKTAKTTFCVNHIFFLWTQLTTKRIFP